MTRSVDKRLADLLVEIDPEASAGPAPSAESFERAWRLAEALDSNAERTRGRHGTPRAVARALAAGVDVGAGPLVDPASGAGALLLAGLEQRWRATGRFEPEALVGFDIDPDAVAMTEAVIAVASGRPGRPPRGRYEVRDFLREGLGSLPTHATVLANPPWGVKPSPMAVGAWKTRVGAALAELLVGEINIYTLFLLEVVLGRGLEAGFVTPIHWLHRRSLTAMRRALCDCGRLDAVTLLRKRVFDDAPDMIPALTHWRVEATDAPIALRRTGFRAALPLGEPLATRFRSDVPRETWRNLPFQAFPLLRSDRFAGLSRLLHGWPRLSDPEAPRERRWLHLGDGAYKTRVRPHLREGGRGPGWPILTRAAQVGRYRLDAAESHLDETGLSALTDGERERFAAPKVILHAIKKAAASWRLGGAVQDDPAGPLALTNNFLIGVGVAYEGDLFYPLALLSSRLFNRLYTEHFPGVNIEAYTVGVLPFAWPLEPSGGGPPEPADDGPLAWYHWARGLATRAGYVPETLYDGLRKHARALQEGAGDDLDRDLAIEAAICGLFGLSQGELEAVLELDPWVEG